MLAFVAASEETGSTDPTSRCRDESVVKSHAVFGKGVDVGSLYDRVASTAERVIALIVGVEEKNVRP